MTTRIKITNEEGHSIEILFVGQQYVLKPGESHIMAIWKDTPAIVRELPENGDIARLESEGGIAH